ncbi:ribosome biogenesis GTP-binding protein YihA/YsxC [Roseateles sp. MS654]|uniref:ribosome biogenesis GTP-binding protein YihA/YsxC n=1 Tax=Roseateles sp. MS654 TaxID=3412685 RepID=UPI003C2DEC06
MTDSNKKPAPAAPGKPAGRGAGRAGASKKKQGPGKTGQRAAAKARAKATEKARAQGLPPPVKPASTEPLTPGKRALAWTHTARFLTTASQLKHLPINGVLPAEARARQAEEDVDGLEDEWLDDADVGAPEADAGAAVESEGEALAQDQAPRRLPEIAFVGRSNAGKSTAVNALAQQKRLAFASKTPGRTQHINLFAVGPRDAPDALFADLPGYGYAAVARDAKLRWQRVMADYLSERESLSGVVLMVDSRLGLTDLDKQLLEFVSERVTAGEVSLLVVLTKADKLNRKEGAAVLAQVQKDLAVLATEDSDIAVTLFSALSKQGLEDVAELIYEWAHRPPRELADDEAFEEDEDADDDADEDARP